MAADLSRFLKAQEQDYGQALREIRSGRKRSHWMWYIFPQIQGLGFSPTAQYYAIRDLQEARDYLAHPVLGTRLKEISSALLALNGRVRDFRLSGRPEAAQQHDAVPHGRSERAGLSGGAGKVL